MQKLRTLKGLLWLAFEIIMVGIGWLTYVIVLLISIPIMAFKAVVKEAKNMLQKRF